MPTDKASYRAQDTGDTLKFKDMPPKVWPDSSTSDAPFDSIAPDHLPYEGGSDTYTGLPGDGVTPG